MITLGALLADTPHTRPVPVTGTSFDKVSAARYGLSRSKYQGPTGIVGVLQDAFVQAGTETQKRERDLWKTETENYIRQATDKGAKINDDVDVSACQQAVKPVLEKNKGTFGDLLKLLPVS